MNEWSKYLEKPFLCECNKVHECTIQTIIVEEHATEQLPNYLKTEGFQKVLLVSDKITEELMGKTLESLLRVHYIDYSKVILSSEEPLPNEKFIWEIEEKIKKDCELIIAVGSGTINDLCKYVSYQKDIPYLIVATAPSMDGYASNVAAMLLNNAKTTVETGRPRAIFADTKVLAGAPMELIAAGVGDMLGKHVCLADWELSHIITGEYYCSYVKGLMKEALLKVETALSGIAKRDEGAIESLMAGLILSGIAMSYLGNSRPASGSEHHLSHFWEMTFLRQNKPAVLHGAKVGVGTIIGLSLYQEAEKILSQEIIPEGRREDTNWEEEIRRVYGDVAGMVIELEHKEQKNSAQKVATRLSVLKRKRTAIMEVIHQLTKSEEINSMLQSLSAPTNPLEIGVEEQLVKDGIYYAKELRNRYGVLQLLYDLDKVEEVLKRILVI